MDLGKLSVNAYDGKKLNAIHYLLFRVMNGDNEHRKRAEISQLFIGLFVIVETSYETISASHILR